MSSIHFTKNALAKAMAQGVRQCVLIGSRHCLQTAVGSTPGNLTLFALDEQRAADCPATFVPTRFASEPLASALNNSHFDGLKASVFVWLGDVGYRTIDAVVASLAFVGSLPKGSAVVLDYATERTTPGSLPSTALDVLSSRITCSGGYVKHLIEPQAISVMLRGLGFGEVLDLGKEEEHARGERLVLASV